MEYIKLDPDNRELEVVLNCSDGPLNVGEGGEILFARKYDRGILEKNGTLIRKKAL